MFSHQSDNWVTAVVSAPSPSQACSFCKKIKIYWGEEGRFPNPLLLLFCANPQSLAVIPSTSSLLARGVPVCSKLTCGTAQGKEGELEALSGR